ncbi:hypothetical protein VNI00_006378 [Paramarasmius palmivorus]|uniref:Major facilitator superfamily (MFS) profile domain-containing protein n=1 Tax=Paramarasmius palmivorus TaxID=297713 RepID=A0AAW0D597_9AGAR
MPIGWVSIALALLASIGGFIFGYDTGQISDILLMDDFKRRFAICESPGIADTCTFPTVRSGLLVSMLSIGTLVGSLIGAPTADYFGRKRAMQMECAFFLIGSITQITSMSVWQQYAVGRMLSGFAVGALSAAVPMYQAEAAPSQIRGTLTATYQLFITFGILTAYCISIGTRVMDSSGSWRTVVGIGITWPTILGLGISFMPESPRWLAKNGEFDKAALAVARARGIDITHPLVVKEMEDMRSNIEWEKQFTGQSGWIDCFRTRNKTLYRTLLGMALQSIQQLTGANYFFYYGATIFSSVGLSDSFVTQIILGAFGRRIPLILGGMWQSIWLFVFAAAGTAVDPRDNANIGYLMIVSACLFILGYATTWAPGVWIIVGETFPMRTRAKQGALATASNWLWNFLIAFFTPFIAKAIDFKYGFVFASCNLAGAVIAFLFLYESSELSLESVDIMYNDPNCKPWNSGNWAPEGYANRKELVEQSRAAQAHKDMAKPGVEEGRVEKYANEGGASGASSNVNSLKGMTLGA